MTAHEPPGAGESPSGDGAEQALLAELRAGQLDPVPAEVVVAVKSAFMWRTVDAELAELLYDSHLEP